MTMKVFGNSMSGNCLKVKYCLDYLAIPYEWHEVDSGRGETRTPEFLAMNPNGKVPLLQTEDGRYLPESNAIMLYLADGISLVPEDRFRRAQMMQWLFWEQYSHEPYLAVARFIDKFLPQDHPRRAELPRLRERSKEVLALMDAELARRDFFVGDSFTLADIALYPYTAMIGDADIDLSPYRNVNAWLRRVAQELQLD